MLEFVGESSETLRCGLINPILLKLCNYYVIFSFIFLDFVYKYARDIYKRMVHVIIKLYNLPSRPLKRVYITYETGYCNIYNILRDPQGLLSPVVVLGCDLSLSVARVWLCERNFD